MFDRSECGVQTYLRWKLYKVKRSWKNWSASVCGAGSRVCCVRGTMKPLLTSVSLARRHASKSTLLLKPSTLSSRCAVSGKQRNKMYFLVIDRSNDQLIVCFLAGFDIYLFLVFITGASLFIFAQGLSRLSFHFSSCVDRQNNSIIIIVEFNTCFFLCAKESSLLLLCRHEHRNDCLSHHHLFHIGSLFAEGNLFHSFKDLRC